MTFRSVNPATGQLIREYEVHTPGEIDARLSRAWSAFVGWRRSPPSERSAVLHRLASLLRDGAARYASLITLEMGKPITEARAEVEKCAWCCEYYARHGSLLVEAESVPSNARTSYVQYLPLGPILAIMPWNFPLWQVIRAAIPAIYAGNTVLLKHASNVTGAALAIEDLFTAADAPSGIFQVLLTPGADVGQVIDDERIRGVTLTGSDVAGSQTGALAGRALKKTVLELGGSDAFIVLEDADLEAAVTAAIRARYQNSGQSCIAAKRFLLVDSIADRFTEMFVAGVAQLKVGDPTDPDTQIGPLAREDLRATLLGQLERSVDVGAALLIGGQTLAGDGFFVEPAVLGEVTPSMPAFRQETFGPLAALTRVGGVDEAVELANRSAYGLASNIWTQDVALARELAGGIEAGAVFINGIAASDPRLPFGGVKRSGFGRELGTAGIREFVNLQTVWIGPAAGPSGEAYR